MSNRPWFLIVLFAFVSLYCLFAIYASASYFFRIGHSLHDMQAYIPTLFAAVVCGAVMSIGLYFRKKPAETVTKWAGGGLVAFIKPTTSTWVSLGLLILSWGANAVLSIFLLALSVGNVYVAYSFLASNLLGIGVSCWLFGTGKRITAIKSTWSVVPLTLMGWFIAMLVLQ